LLDESAKECLLDKLQAEIVAEPIGWRERSFAASPTSAFCQTMTDDKTKDKPVGDAEQSPLNETIANAFGLIILAVSVVCPW